MAKFKFIYKEKEMVIYMFMSCYEIKFKKSEQKILCYFIFLVVTKQRKFSNSSDLYKKKYLMTI